MRFASIPLPKLCSLVTDGTHDSPKLQASGIPFIKGKDISSGEIDFTGCDFISEQDHELCKKRVVPTEGDVLISNIGSVGDTARVKDSREFSIKNVALLRPDLSQTDSAYFYFLIKSPQFKGQLLNMRLGAAQPYISLENLRSMWATVVVEKSVQRRIGDVLSHYDDLIENNRRRIKLLEESARLLYREWFVRFRFPGHEHMVIKNQFPIGWSEVMFEDMLDQLESGGRPKGGAADGGNIPSVGAENVIGLGQYDYSKEKYISDIFFEHMSRGVVKNRDVLLYKDGANIGRSSYFGEGFPHGKCAVNEHVFILRSQPHVGQNFLYFWISQDDSRQAIANLNSNTAQPGISQDKLRKLKILLPARNLLALFNEDVDPIVMQIFKLALMNKTLSTARDILLPKLMTGEVLV